MKQRITVTVDSDSYQLLKAYDVNISGLVIVCLWMFRVTLLTRPGDGW